MKRRGNTLSETLPGTYFYIHEIRSGPEISQKLRELGFREHTMVRTVINNSHRLICEIENTRIGLHHDVASDIIGASRK